MYVRPQETGTVHGTDTHIVHTVCTVGTTGRYGSAGFGPALCINGARQWFIKTPVAKATRWITRKRHWISLPWEPAQRASLASASLDFDGQWGILMGNA